MISGFTNPLALLGFLLAIPIVALYMLKPRRRPHSVPSTFLWREASNNVAATKPWQRPRPSMTLLLQLLLLAALVLMLARPYRETSGIAGDHLVIVIDTSGSMLSTDVTPNRIEAAKVEGRRLLDTLRAGGVASLISAGPRPRAHVSASNSPRVVERELARLQASQGEADFAEAFLLAESLELPGRLASIVLISDGGLTPEEKRLIPPDTIFRSVGSSAGDLAITSLEVGEGPGGFEAFVSVRNSGSSDRDTELLIELDGRPLAASGLTLPAGSAVEKSFDLGEQTGRLQARIEVEDVHEEDNRAYAVLERTRPRRVLVVTPGNLFLQKLVEQLPGAQVDVVESPSAVSGYDLAVFDRVAVPPDLKLPALFIAPTVQPDPVVQQGEVATPQITYLAAGDSLLEHVDLSELAIAKTQAVEITGGRTLIGTEGTPLVATWNQGTLRRAWIGFDLHESNLPLQVAFPILGDHLLSWLTGAEPNPARHAGDQLSQAGPPGATSARITSPDGRVSALQPTELFTSTDEAGFYSIQWLRGDDVLAERTEALSFPPREADLRPAELVIPTGAGRPGITSNAIQPNIWAIAALALLLLFLEWWWAHGRPLPRRTA